MGRGRSGSFITSPRKMRVTAKGHWGCSPGALPSEKKIMVTPQDVEVAKSLTKEQLAYILFKGGNSVSGGTTISSSRTKPRLGPSNK